jgi:hypothetical protein
MTMDLSPPHKRTAGECGLLSPSAKKSKTENDQLTQDDEKVALQPQLQHAAPPPDIAPSSAPSSTPAPPQQTDNESDSEPEDVVFDSTLPTMVVAVPEVPGGQVYLLPRDYLTLSLVQYLQCLFRSDATTYKFALPDSSNVNLTRPTIIDNDEKGAGLSGFLSCLGPNSDEVDVAVAATEMRLTIQTLKDLLQVYGPVSHWKTTAASRAMEKICEGYAVTNPQAKFSVRNLRLLSVSSAVNIIFLHL